MHFHNRRTLVRASKWAYLTTLLYMPSAAFAEQCIPQAPLASTVATANLWDNLRGSEGSISHETAEILEEAERALSKQGATSQTAVRFDVRPHKDIERTPANEKALLSCEAREKSAPPVIVTQTFSKLSELDEWFSDFSQGKGPDGERLYRRCDGGCSPHYSSIITQVDQGYRVRTSAVCGLPRDKQENNYQITATLERRCE